MKYDDFIKAIMESEIEDWSYDDDLGLYVLKNDIRITITSDRDDNDDTDFYEEWARNFPDENAKRARFYLRFNGSVIEAFYTAAVDGYRCLIPYPNRSNMSISIKQYKIGSILNIPYRDFDEYLKQASIKISS